MKNYVFVACLGLTLLFACSPGDKEKAALLINKAETAITAGDTLNAITFLDSVAACPKAEGAQQKATAIKREIFLNWAERIQNRIDSNRIVIVDLEKKFNKEKGEFDRYIQYVPKRQTFKRAWDRSFIQVHLDERGELFMSSNYYGEKWLNHTGLRVYDGELQAKTEEIPLGDANNHQSDFSGAKWEKVSYRNGKDNGVIEFIANHTDRRLKAVFLGKRHHYIILETFDKDAVKDALALSKALKREQQLQQEKVQLENKLKGL